MWPFDKGKMDQEERKEPSFSSTNNDPDRERRRAIMRATIDRQKAIDPLIGAKITGKDIHGYLMTVLKNERGVHAETLLTVVGALAGFACQASVIVKCILQKSDIPLAVVETKDGRKLLYGEALNEPLVYNKHSFWNLAGGAAQHLGAVLPDLETMVRASAAAIGTEKFGVPTYQGAHPAGDVPINYLRVFWPTIFPMLQRYQIDSDEWPIALGLAAQDAIFQGKDVIDAGSAVRILMESAIPMSKIRSEDVVATPDHPGQH